LSSDTTAATKGTVGVICLLIREVGTFDKPKEAVKKLISFAGSKIICCFSFKAIVPKLSSVKAFVFILFCQFNTDKEIAVAAFSKEICSAEAT